MKTKQIKKCPVCGSEVCPQNDLEYEDVDILTGKKKIFKVKDGTLACMECAWFEGSENQ
jgi:predicted nucleic-acid-binding Zn-ribbon protein